METTLIVAGVAFVGAAIVGGGLIAFKIEIPLVDSIPRQILLGLFGAVLIVAGFMSGSGAPTSDQVVTAANTTPAETASTTPSTQVTTTTVATTSSTTTIVPTTSATTTVATTPPIEWTLVLDGDGQLGVTVPQEWTVEVTANEIWAAPDLANWTVAMSGEGPATTNGYYLGRFDRPDEGTLDEIARDYLDQLSVPTQCALMFSDVEKRPASRYMNEAYFMYDVYQCVPGGELVNEVEVGWSNPTWVTLESSRYANDADRELYFDPIWQSFTTY
ncbi:MAG: hypothetical protein HKO03_09610 [Acidimicrobiia bacterium]|nr:hypothetical protein [Acidimicrobiia bacterium]